MDDYISREAVLALETDLHFDGIEQLKYWRCHHIDPTAVKILPAADVRPVVRAEWFFVEELNEHFGIYCCKKCGAHKNFRKDELKPYFCEWCGADMREVDSDG